MARTEGLVPLPMLLLVLLAAVIGGLAELAGKFGKPPTDDTVIHDYIYPIGMSAVSMAVRALVLADYVLYSSGAGMGVDSGLPDFRGN